MILSGRASSPADPRQEAARLRTIAATAGDDLLRSLLEELADEYLRLAEDVPAPHR